jgi:hypothetical protein
MMSVHLFLGIVMGGILGFAVYYFTGVSAGSWPIASNPAICTIAGIGLGAMLAKLN